MSELEHLLALARDLGPAELAEVVDFAEFVATKRGRKADAAQELDEESRAWMAADLAPPIEPYDWGPEGPPVGKPIRYEPGLGFVIEGGRDG